MKKNFFLQICLFAFGYVANGQAYRTFNGRVVDSASLQPLKDATISIYRASDTSLLNFGFTTPLGNFTISTKSDDSLLVIVSLLNYSDKVIKDPAAEGWRFMTLGDVKLRYDPVTNMQGATIRGSAIRMKGDTIEINASRFKVLPGSDVAQLFKKIPGFEVNVKGEIKVNGSEVTKIMVDGSNFFGNNPSMVSKNLNADMIETVQVFDDKNEDGSPKENTPKIINLKLKKGKKNGLFGDLMAGAGTSERYELGARMNSFKNDRKFSVVFNKNNTNNTGFDFGFGNWHSVDNYSRNGSGESDFYYYDPSFSGEGNLNNKSNLGMTYFNEFKGKKKLSFNLDVSQNNFSSISSNNSFFALNDTINRNNYDSSYSTGISRKIYANINFTKSIDSTGYFEIGATGSMNQLENNSQIFNNIKFNELQINNGIGLQKNLNDGSFSSVNASYRRNLRKDKRYVFSVYSDFKYTGNNSNKYQYQENNIDTINFLNSRETNSYEILTKVFGRMPIYKKTWFFNLSADRWYQNNQSVQLTNGANLNNNRTFEQEYNQSVDTLSVKFNNTQEQYTIKPYFSLEGNHFYLSIGTTLMSYNLFNNNITQGTQFTKNFPKNLPYISVNYYPESLGWFYIMLSKSTNFPTVNDLQPVLNINNNYERTIGNSNLQPQDNYSMRLYSNLRKVKGFKHIYTYLTANISDNAKVLSKTQNDNGILVTMPVNATGMRNFSGYISTRKTITKVINLGLGYDYDISRDPLLVNDVKSYGLNKGSRFSPNINISKSDSLELDFGMNIRYTKFTNSLNSAVNYSQMIYSYEASIRTLLGFGMEINSTLDIQDQRNVPNVGKLVPVWSMYLQQPIGKSNFNLKFTAYDILKQNTSISRFASDNFVVINRSNRLQQYFMLTLVYKIKKMGGEEDGGFVF